MKYEIGKEVYITSLGLCGVIIEYKGDFDRFYCIDVFGTIYYYLHEELEMREE